MAFIGKLGEQSYTVEIEETGKSVYRVSVDGNEFIVDGKKHALVLEGDPSFFDADRAAADVQKIVEAGRVREAARLWAERLATRDLAIVDRARGAWLGLPAVAPAHGQKA